MLTAEDRALGWLALLRLRRRPGLEPQVLLERLGEPALWLLPGRTPCEGGPALREAARGIDWRGVEHDARWLRASPARLVTWGDPAYPPLLREIPDPPPALFCLGDLPASRPLLAIVGSRQATHAGRAAAYGVASELARAGLGIVSGMAVGIDANAHRGALAGGGPTVAVLGSGLARIYPRQHAALAAEIAAGGAVITEYPPATPPARRHFPHRNRIISGLCLGVLVVEAARRSGSLITARLAGEQGREVFAMPGAIASPLSRGCHRLIREGAVLVEGSADVLCELGSGWRAGAAPTSSVVASAVPGDPPAGEAAASGPCARPGRYAPGLDLEVLRCVDFAPTALDAIVERSGLTPDVVSSILLALELDGQVRAELGGAYVRSPASVA